MSFGSRIGRMFVEVALWVSVCLACNTVCADSAPASHDPGALNQFDFLVGTYECEDVFTSLDGKQEKLPSTWKGEYILGGLGIQDSYVNAKFHATNIRTYDPKSDRWRVTYFREPGGITGVWEGGVDSGQLVLHRMFEHNGRDTLSRLIFNRPAVDAFQWRSEYHSDGQVFVDWTSDCQQTARKSS